MSESKKVVLPTVRLSYVHLAQPRSANPGDEPKYSVAVLIPKSDTKTIKEINDAVNFVIENSQDKLKTKKGLKHPLRDGDTESEEPAYEGHMFFSANSKSRPIILDKDKNEILDFSEVYSGMYAQVVVNFYAFNVKNKGIAAGLQAVRKMKDGEPLGATYTHDMAADDFKDNTGGEPDDDGLGPETDDADDLI